MIIKLYILPKSAWCLKAKEWLKKKKLVFQEIDLEESSASGLRDEVILKTSQIGVPVIEINGQFLVGFHEKEWEEAIEKASKS